MAPETSADEESRDAPLAPDSDATYELVYRATRDAIWDVLGTATLILFYLALAAISLSIAFAGLGPYLRGSASYTALAVGLVALGVGFFAVYRVFRLVTE
ncbi:hypothetical protein [Halobellus inordinatus]|uniref:hypothetical protein n=1 Tax=Halobellus inordinatus TaxID=1126236 RepID=UPI00210EADE2|nr:hypothetical protein [Halobellus inordinatus]